VPVRVVDVRNQVKLKLKGTETVVERALRGLEAVQRGGSLTATQVGGDPKIDVSDVDLQYAAINRPLRGGRFRVRGGEARIDLPRRNALALSGDVDRVRTTLQTREAEDLSQNDKDRGRFVALEVLGADVEVRPLP
jgi:hypothetical protein